jgi:hypothetical protein
LAGRGAGLIALAGSGAGSVHGVRGLAPLTGGLATGFFWLFTGADLGDGMGLAAGSPGRPEGVSASAPPDSTWTVPSSTRSKMISRISAYSCLRAPSSSASAVSLMPGVTRRDRVSMIACRSIVDIVSFT